MRIPSGAAARGYTCQAASAWPRNVASLVPAARSQIATSPRVDADATSTSFSPAEFGTKRTFVTDPSCRSALAGSDDPKVHAHTLPSVSPATMARGDTASDTTHAPSHPTNLLASLHPVPRTAISSQRYTNTCPSHPAVTAARPNPTAFANSTHSTGRA